MLIENFFEYPFARHGTRMCYSAVVGGGQQLDGLGEAGALGLGGGGEFGGGRGQRAPGARPGRRPPSRSGPVATTPAASSSL